MNFLLFGTVKPRVLQCLGGLNSRLEENRSINGCGINVFPNCSLEEDAAQKPPQHLLWRRAAFTCLHPYGGSEQVARLL